LAAEDAEKNAEDAEKSVRKGWTPLHRIRATPLGQRIDATSCNN
jgi:hypothetical protein